MPPHDRQCIKGREADDEGRFPSSCMTAFISQVHAWHEPNAGNQHSQACSPKTPKTGPSRPQQPPMMMTHPPTPIWIGGGAGGHMPTNSEGSALQATTSCVGGGQHVKDPGCPTCSSCPHPGCRSSSPQPGFILGVVPAAGWGTLH